jgi:hypothetical protein
MQRPGANGARGRRIAPAVAFALALVPGLAGADAAPAGTTIVNVARLGYGTGGEATAVASNEVTLTVARVLDVAVTAAVATRPYGDAVPVRVRFTVRNLGNAAERFTLSATADSPFAAVAGIVADASGASSLGTGASAAIDLPPGAAIDVDVLVTLADGSRADVPMTLAATATTAHGAPGTVAPGSPDAIVGRTGASAAARTLLVGNGAVASPPADGDAPTLAKSQSVRAPDGSARVMPGSVVTYRLEAHVPVATAAVAIDDAIPLGTAYVLGSLTLDGAALSDAGDVDPGRFDGAAIHVALGDLPAAATRIVQFQAVIQ